MKIDELIEALMEYADDCDSDSCASCSMCGLCNDGYHPNKIAEVIKLLWEIAQDNSNSKYKMQFDEWSGNDEKG